MFEPGQVNKLDRGGESAFFGDVCERYAGAVTRKDRAAAPPPDLSVRREKLVLERIESISSSGAAPQEARTPIEKLLEKYAARVPWATAPRPPAHGQGKAGLTIGIPRASLYFELIPLWAAMFKSLGFARSSCLPPAPRSSWRKATGSSAPRPACP